MKKLYRVYRCSLCEWRSNPIEEAKDDGSLMTDYRRHFEHNHAPQPYIGLVELEVDG